MESLFRFRSLKFGLLSVLFIAQLALGTSTVYAGVAGPGWNKGVAEPVSPQQARDYYLSLSQATFTTSALTTAAVAPQTLPEIVALARALQNDPKLIHEYVHNHIDYVPYYGYLKGPVLTLLDRSGNDFDQAALMVALLRAAGHTADFVFGQMTIPNFGAADQRDMQHWLSVDANANIIAKTLSSGGIPTTVTATSTTLDRVWVQATVGGSQYLFDPAFKQYTEIPGTDLKTAMGYLRSDLLTAAGGTLGTDSIQNLDYAGLSVKLAAYSGNLAAYLRSNLANADMEQVTGGREIVAEYLDQLPIALAFPSTVTTTWIDIPAAYTHTVRIQHGGIDQTLNVPEVAAHKLAMTYDTGFAAASTLPLSAPDTPVTFATPAPASLPGDAVGSASVSGDTFTTQAVQPTVDLGRVTPSFTGWPSWGITFTNNNTVTISVAANLLNNASGAYRFLSGGGTTALSPGQSVTIRLEFNGTAQARGTKTATFRLEQIYSGTVFASDDWPLTGFVADAPSISLSGYTGANSYLNVPVDTTVNLHNNGSFGLSVDATMTLTGANPTLFQLISGQGVGTIAAASSRGIGWRYLANAVGSHSANINVQFSYDGIAYPASNLIALSGTTTSAPIAQLWLDDTIVAQETAPISGGLATTMTLSIDHPYSALTGTYADQTSDYDLTRGSTYVILSEFSGSRDGLLLKQRQRLLDKLRAGGLADNSREVLTESLNVMGQTWMRQTTLSDRMLAEVSDTISIRHHRFGIMAQETGYYVDIKSQLTSTISRHGVVADEATAFRAGNFLASALEHGVLEQLQGVTRPAVSTVRLLHLTNQGGGMIFRADAANWATVQPQLTGYSAADLTEFGVRVNAGAILILPADGQIVFNQWRGKGYIDSQENADGSASVGMIIGGNLFGGYLSIPGVADPFSVTTEFSPELALKGQITNPASAEPVDMATGAYLYNHQDLGLGGAEPNGLHFGRNYNSDDRHTLSTLGHGWDHGYNIVLDLHSDVESGLGQRAPLDATAMLVASVVSLDLMTPVVPDLKDWTTATLIGQWSMEQLFENAVSVRLQDKALAYIQLPDGSYNPPPGMTTALVKNGSLFELRERFGTVIAFDASNRISTWTDVDGNQMSFTYSGNNLATVTDSVGRSLTLTYTGSQLTSVTDSSGRVINYSYDLNGDLATFSDADGQPWGFGYDTDHRITTVRDALNVTLASNTYDALDQVDTQTYPRDGLATVTFNYYFSASVMSKRTPTAARRCITLMVRAAPWR